MFDFFTHVVEMNLDGQNTCLFVKQEHCDGDAGLEQFW